MSEQSPTPSLAAVEYFRTPTSAALLLGTLGGAVALLAAVFNWHWYTTPAEFLCIWASLFVQFCNPALSRRRWALVWRALGRSLQVNLFRFLLIWLGHWLFITSDATYMLTSACISHIATLYFGMKFAQIHEVDVKWSCATVTQLCLIPYHLGMLAMYLTITPGQELSADAQMLWIMMYWLTKILSSFIPAVVVENELRRKQQATAAMERALQSAAAPPAVPAASGASNATR